MQSDKVLIQFLSYFNLKSYDFMIVFWWAQKSIADLRNIFSQNCNHIEFLFTFIFKLIISHNLF